MDILDLHECIADLDDFARMSDINPKGQTQALISAVEELEQLRAKVAELQSKLALTDKDNEQLISALTQFLDQEGNPPADTGEWRYVLQVLGERE